MSADFKAAGTIAMAYSIGRNEKPNCYEVKEMELLEYIHSACRWSRFKVE